MELKQENVVTIWQGNKRVGIFVKDEQIKKIISYELRDVTDTDAIQKLLKEQAVTEPSNVSSTVTDKRLIP